METITKHVLSAKEAADYLGVHINTISKHVEIPRFRIGGRVLFRKEKQRFQMQEITRTLERNAKEIQFGSVSVELRIHDGRVVKTLYKTTKATVTRSNVLKEQKTDKL